MNLVLFGSPHENGSTFQALKKNCKEYKKFYLINCFKKKISPCIDCKFCKKNFKCIIYDDMIEVYDKIETCNKFILASPIYNFSFPSPVKAILDRTQCYFYKNILKTPKRQASLITVSGSRDRFGVSVAEKHFKYFCKIAGFEFIKSISYFKTDLEPVFGKPKI
ncbi:MAG: flavodoxin family protein [Oscillospiraceae bacterium]|jgi:multimeric flavodoxin WrbA|nr:flavodoxin family protein [Oscillospiraceae bacterium]